MKYYYGTFGSYYLLKKWMLNTFLGIKKYYSPVNLSELRGTELQYVSNDLCMPVYIADIGVKGITLMGRWFDTYTMKFEEEDSVIFCINVEAEKCDLKTLVKRINEAIHTGVWTHSHKAGYWDGGNIDRKCAFK